MKVGILGAGIAGLSVGWLLSRRGVDVTLFERQPYVGGLARSFRWNGFSCDFAAHRLFCSDERVLQQLLALVPMGRHIRRSRIRMHGKWLHDPVNVGELALQFFPGTAARIALTYLFRPRSGLVESFEDYVTHRYGSELSEFFFKPYTEKMFGISAGQIALDWAVRKVRIAGPLDGVRPSSKTKFSYFYYPIEGGYGAIAAKLAAELGDRIKTETSVVELRAEETSITGITYQQGGQTRFDEFDQVVSTLPLPVLGRMLGKEFPLSFQKVEAVYLLIDRPFVSDNHWIYFMDRESVINRMVEFKNMSSVSCPTRQTVLCAEVTAKCDDVVERVVEDVVKTGLIVRSDVLDSLVVREPFSYPVYDTRYRETVASARVALSRFRNLHLLGRAAEFEHKEVDDNFGSAVELTERIIASDQIVASPRPSPVAPSPQVSPLVYAVILCLNNLVDTLQCLASVSNMDYENLRIVLVDNGSTDGTAGVVAERFPNVEVIGTGRNLGVPAGFNIGFSRALGVGADYILMLNNDTTVAPDMLRELLEVSQADSTVGIAMPKVLYYDHPDVVWSAGGRRRRFPPAIVFIGLGRSDDDRFSELKKIEYAPSCGLLIQRRAFQLAGLFDPGYLFYYDDWDFSERVRAHGMSIAFVPRAKMWHKVSRTTRSRSDLYWRTWGESCVRFYRRHGRPVCLSLPIHLGYILLREVLKGNARSLGHFLQGARSGLSRPLGPIPTLSEQDLRSAS